MHFYTAEEIEYLKEITPGRSNKEITLLFNEKFRLNLSEKAIGATRKRHGIKTETDGRFEKGHIPFNKGKKGISYPGMEKTQFKKGHTPKNHRPIGSERTDSKDGYLLIKVAEPNKWKAKHRVIWEEHNGPLPKSCTIIFGDGDKRNFDLNNLILVSRRELLTLNQNDLIQKDAELTKTAVNIAKLKIKMQEVKRK